MHLSAEPSLQRCYFEHIYLSTNKSSLQFIIIEQRVGVLFSQLTIRFVLELVNLWTKPPQIAEEQLVMTMDKAQETKLQRIQKLVFQCFLLKSAKAKKFQNGDRSIRLYTTISLQLRRSSKIHTHILAEDDEAFQMMCSNCLQIKKSLRSNRTDRQTDTHTHRHKIRLL